MEYQNNSSLPDTAYDNASGAAYNWNQLSNTFTINGFSRYNDIVITDNNNLPSNILGGTQNPPTSHAATACNNHPDACGMGVCYNSGTMYQVSIQMNANEIRSRATGANLPLSLFAMEVAAHEFGHALGFDDEPELPSTCDQIESVMDNGNTNRTVCGYSSPVGGCDAAGKSMRYPSVVPAYCTGGCDLNASC